MRQGTTEMAGGKMRLDLALVEKGFFQSRERARSAIMAGEILVDGRPAVKPGMAVDTGSTFTRVGNDLPYVSRGGLKMEKAIEAFNLDLRGKVVLDIGASTGGFTDCALQHGARLVYAVDVGYGQLAWKLRQDPRVVVMERTNFRYLEPNTLTEVVDLATVDVSFISLDKILPVARRELGAGGKVMALIKPQFEAGRHQVGKHGVVRTPEVHIQVIENVFAKARIIGLYPVELTFSPITGPKGNIEYLTLLKLSPGETPEASQVVSKANEVLQSGKEV